MLSIKIKAVLEDKGLVVSHDDLETVGYIGKILQMMKGLKNITNARFEQAKEEIKTNQRLNGLLRQN